MPPGWLFGPVWSVLYLGMGIASWLVWNSGFANREVKIALTFYVIQLVMNVLWTAIFFALNSHYWGFVEIIALDVLVIVTMVLFWRISHIAGIIFAAYTAWLMYATALNWWITRHNI